MAVIPTPVIAAVTPFAYTETDQDISLDGTASVKSDAGSAISTWSWSIFHYPEGTTPVNCYLTGANTSTPTLRYPGGFPGTVGVILTITDDNADPTLDESYPNIYPSQNGASSNYGKGAYAVIGPVKTQVVFVSMLTVEGLLLPAVGHRAWFPEVGGYWDLVKKVTSVGVALDSFTSAKLQRARFVSSVAGDAEADGSIANPFNPTSAAAKTNPFTGLPFVGPLAQAQVALIDLSMTEDPSQGYTVIVHGGTYNENINIGASSAKVPWHYIFLDDTQFTNGNTFAYAAAAVADQLAAPNLRITCHGTVSNFAHGGFALSNTDSTWTLEINGDFRVAGNVSVSGSFAAGPTAHFDGPTFAGTFNVPNLRLLEVDSTTFSGALTCRDVYEGYNSTFASVTVTQAGGGDRSGFYHCGWSAAPVFTGPAGSALFDPITRHRFAAVSGAYAGGAGVDDLLFVGALHSNEAQFAIRAESGDLGLTADGHVIIDGNTGYVTISAVTLVAITATGDEASEITLSADDTITSTSGGSTTIEATNGVVNVTGANGVTVATTGANKALTLQTADGHINLAAAGVAREVQVGTTNGDVEIAASGTARSVHVSTADGGINLTAGGAANGDISLEADATVTIVAPYVAIADPLGSSWIIFDDNEVHPAAALDIRRATGDIDVKALLGDVFLEGQDGVGYSQLVVRGSGDPYLYGTASAGLASPGYVDIQGDDYVSIFSSGGNVVIFASTTIEADGELVTHSGAADSTFHLHRVVTCPGTDGTANGTVSTTEETAATKEMAAGFWATSGVALKGEIDFDLADNANTKTLTWKIEGTTVATLTGTAGTFQNKRMRIEFEATKSDSANTLMWRIRYTAIDAGTKSATTGYDFGTVSVTTASTADVTWLMQGTSNDDIIFRSWRTWTLAG